MQVIGEKGHKKIKTVQEQLRFQKRKRSCNLRGLAVADALANGRSAEAQRSAGEPDTDHWTTHWMIIYYSSFFDSIITI